MKPPYFNRFRTRLLLLLLLLAIPAVGLLIYSNLEQREIEMARVQEGAIAISKLAAANQENFIQNARQILATVADYSFLVSATDHAFAQTHFANLRRLLPDYANFGLIELDGTVFCSAEPLDPAVNLADRSYFRRVVQTRDFATGDFMIGRFTGAQVINFGFPIFDDKGILKRVLYASLRVSRLSEALGAINLQPGATVAVLDQGGTVLARQPSPEAWVGKNVSKAPVAERILAQKDPVFEMAGLDGVRRLHAVTPIKQGSAPSLFVTVGIPVRVSFAHANDALVRNLIIFGLVALVVWGAARSYSGQFIVEPINALNTAAHELAQGNLDARVNEHDGPTEIAQLGQSFNQMADRLQERRREIEKAKDQIQTLNQDLENRVAERTAQLRAANQELETFSYSVSHDLRAPLRAINGFSQALLEDSGPRLDENGLGQLRRVREAAERMGHLIDDLLGLARVTRSEIRRSEFNLSELAEIVISEIRKGQPGRQVETIVSTGMVVTADPRLLRIVLENLIGNAWKFTARVPAAVIEIGSLPRPKTKEYFVRDNGAGFEMAYAAKLFEAFQRLHRANEFDGTGIGLATVRRVIQRHGGEVRAEGEVDKGATFFFTLPS